MAAGMPKVSDPERRPKRGDYLAHAISRIEMKSKKAKFYSSAQAPAKLGYEDVNSFGNFMIRDGRRVKVEYTRAEELTVDVPYSKLQAFDAGPQRGWGVRCTAPINEGDIVVEVVGRVLNEAEYQELGDENGDKEYIVSFDEKTLQRKQLVNDDVTYIDLREQGNMMRLINDCPDAPCLQLSYLPEADPAKGVLPRRAFLVARHDIPANVELTWNYGKHYPRPWISQPWIQDGAQGEPGTLGSASAETHEGLNKRELPKGKGAKREPSKGKGALKTELSRSARKSGESSPSRSRSVPQMLPPSAVEAVPASAVDSAVVVATAAVDSAVVVATELQEGCATGVRRPVCTTKSASNRNGHKFIAKRQQGYVIHLPRDDHGNYVMWSRGSRRRGRADDEAKRKHVKMLKNMPPETFATVEQAAARLKEIMSSAEFIASQAPAPSKAGRGGTSVWANCELMQDEVAEMEVVEESEGSDEGSEGESEGGAGGGGWRRGRGGI